MSEQKQSPQIQNRLVKYSSSEVSDPSEVPQLVGKINYLVS